MKQSSTESIILRRLHAAGGEMRLHDLMQSVRYRGDHEAALSALLRTGKVERRVERGRAGRPPTVLRLAP